MEELALYTGKMSVRFRHGSQITVFVNEVLDEYSNKSCPISSVVERTTFNRVAVGSTPTLGKTKICLQQTIHIYEIMNTAGR